MEDVSSASTSIANSGCLYHERQCFQLCLVHTLNCLFQRKVFTKYDLDSIAENLHDSRWFNRHRSAFGFGNYDVNVLIAVLQTRDLKVRWFDARLSTSLINKENVFGYIFNVPSRGYLSLMGGRHWFAVREFHDIGFFNFDSMLPEPKYISNFVEFADALLQEGNQLMLVVEPDKVDCIFVNC